MLSEGLGDHPRHLLPEKVFGVLMIALSAGACDWLDPPEPIIHHVDLEVVATSDTLSLGSEIEVRLRVASNRSRPLTLTTRPDGTCLWAISIRDSATDKYPSVWHLRPLEIICDPPDEDIDVGVQAVVELGPIVWDGTVVDRTGRRPLEPGIYYLQGDLFQHDVHISDATYRSDFVASEFVAVEIVEGS